MRPEFSVIIPSYNHEKYIGGAIESVINQTFKDWELIIIDDGSPDNSVEIIRQYKDPRIRLIMQENHDAPYTINRGMKESRGKYISILNSDDIFELTKLQDSYEVLLQGYDFVFGKLSVIDEFNRKISNIDERVEWIDRRLNNSKEKDDVNKLLLNINYLVTTSNFVFDRKLIDEVGFFHEKLHISHDFNYLVKIFFGNYNIKFIPKFQAKYRMHTDNTLSKGKRESFLEACYSISLILRNKKVDPKIISIDFYSIPIVPNILFYYSLLSQEEMENVVSDKEDKHRANLLFIIGNLLTIGGSSVNSVADSYENYNLEMLKKTLQIKDQQIWKISQDLHNVRASMRWKASNFVYKKIKKLQTLFK
jgi:glycosyltransferase involved in cell wall biosynthesis